MLNHRKVEVCSITEKGSPLAKATAIKIAGKEDDCVLLEIGSGEYSFEVNRKLLYF